MAKELPYFKFEPGRWENGNIQMCSFDVQGAFISICSMYWQRLGDLPYRLAVVKICRGDESFIQSMLQAGVIKQDGENLRIDFLDTQLEEFKIISERRSEAGKKGGENRNLSPEISRIKGRQIYVIYCYSNDEEFIKVGITNESISRRFSGKLPYEYQVLMQFSTDDNLDIESYCNDQLYNKHGYVPKIQFQGYLECFKISVIEELSAIMKHRTGIAIAMPNHRSAIREEDIRKDNRREDKKTREQVAVPFLNGCLVAWNDWVEHRKQMRKPLTQKAIEKQIKFLGGRPEPEIIEILNTAIEKNWQGLWPLNKSNNGTKISTTGTIRTTDAIIEQGKDFGIERGF